MRNPAALVVINDLSTFPFRARVCLSPLLIVKYDHLELINVANHMGCANHVGCALSKLSSLVEEIASLFDVIRVRVFHLVPEKGKWGNASSCSCNSGVQ